jgi:hypothetical protein
LAGADTGFFGMGVLTGLDNVGGAAVFLAAATGPVDVAARWKSTFLGGAAGGLAAFLGGGVYTRPSMVGKYAPGERGSAAGGLRQKTKKKISADKRRKLSNFMLRKSDAVIALIKYNKYG